MGAIVCQITSVTIVYSTVYSGTDQRKYQNYSPHEEPVKHKMFPFDDVIIDGIEYTLMTPTAPNDQM